MKKNLLGKHVIYLPRGGIITCSVYSLEKEIRFIFYFTESHSSHPLSMKLLSWLVLFVLWQHTGL